VTPLAGTPHLTAKPVLLGAEWSRFEFSVVRAVPPRQLNGSSGAAEEAPRVFESKLLQGVLRKSSEYKSALLAGTGLR
jgi:hypothetical protein